MMAATSTEPRFLYPQSRQFPFDEVCEQIVRALEERNWSIPGITFDFDVYGTGDEKYRMVRYIRGDDFKLWFCRPQANMGRWNDTAAVTEIVIPRKELHVYDDESGPTFYVYVGGNWEKDKDRFINGSKVNSKLNGEPRTYLKYDGGCDCQSTAGASFPAVELLTVLTGDAKALATMKHTHPGRRSPILVHDNDLGREYDLKKREPKMYRTDEVFAEITKWLEDNLLARIMAQPAADEKIDLFTESITPLPETVGPIFCFGEYNDAQRVHQGTTNVDELNASDRYGFTGGGYRLLSLGVGNDGTVPKVAYDSFKWCGFGEVTGEMPVDTLDVPGHYRWSKERFVFRVKPSHADGVYVADNATYEKRRSELFEEIKPRDRLTDAELAEAERARARTITPITEYDGSYEQPIVLVNRELGFDEIELVSGPWPECQYITLIANRSDEARALLEQALSAQEAYLTGFAPKERKKYDESVARLSGYTLGQESLFATLESAGVEIFPHRKHTHDGVVYRIVEAAGEARKFGLF